MSCVNGMPPTINTKDGPVYLGNFVVDIGEYRDGEKMFKTVKRIRQKLCLEASREVKRALREWPICPNGGEIRLKWSRQRGDRHDVYTSHFCCSAPECGGCQFTARVQP